MAISDQEREQQRKQQEWVQRAFVRHTMEFPIQLKFPAKVVSTNDDDNDDDSKMKKPLRTDSTFLQHRLLEVGLPFTDSGEPCPQTLQETVQKLEKVVHRLQQSGCYDSVNVEIDHVNDPTSGTSTTIRDHNINDEATTATQQLIFQLKEKNWYRLYVGGGIRNDLKSDALGGGAGLVETLRSQAQFETTAGHRVVGIFFTYDLSMPLPSQDRS
jgi:hypothetical protein